MSQLRQPPHRCQIDCTNHEEVITGLELKSKDLYYFWRNYEWLYARYQQSLLRNREQPSPPKQPEVIKEIVTVKESHEKCNKEIEELENANEKLTRENKKIRMELEGYKKQVTELEGNNRFELDYKKKITLLENKNSQIEAINQKNLAEINRLKSVISAAQGEADAERLRLQKEIKRLKQTVVQLQQSIDEYRSRSTQAVSQVSRQEGPSALELEEFKSKQITVISSKIRSLSEQAQRLIAQECDSMRREFQQRFEQTLLSLSQRELQTIIQVMEE